jgi:hypothetical protein
MTSDPQAEEERDDMERVKLDNKRILFNLLPAHVAQHFLMSNPRNMVSECQGSMGPAGWQDFQVCHWNAAQCGPLCVLLLCLWPLASPDLAARLCLAMLSAPLEWITSGLPGNSGEIRLAGMHFFPLPSIPSWAGLQCS